ncbi:MAG: hypothetical protein RLY72_1383 [Planctomycetota bacterium]
MENSGQFERKFPLISQHSVPLRRAFPIDRTMVTRLTAASIALASLFLCAPALAQRAPRGGGPETRTAATTTKDGAIIQWYATLDRGLAEAKRTGKPIMLVSGAPHCAGVSGMWCPGKVKIDNGWLLKDEVVAASRDFVCIRLTSYESAEEAAFVTKLQGNPVNTVFAILTPDALPALAMKGLGRGPGELFADPADMVKQMGEVAAKFAGGSAATKADGQPALPITLDARLGLAVASADLQPLALVIASDERTRAALEAKLAVLAWSNDLRGRFTYASADSLRGLKLDGLDTLKSGVFKSDAFKSCVLLIEPDVFGVEGKIVSAIDATDVDKMLSSAMHAASAKHVRAAKSREQLKRLALANGIFFETGIPVSGKKEAEDRAKFKAQIEEAQKARAATKPLQRG